MLLKVNYDSLMLMRTHHCAWLHLTLPSFAASFQTLDLRAATQSARTLKAKWRKHIRTAPSATFSGTELTEASEHLLNVNCKSTKDSQTNARRAA